MRARDRQVPDGNDHAAAVSFGLVPRTRRSMSEANDAPQSRGQSNSAEQQWIPVLQRTDSRCAAPGTRIALSSEQSEEEARAGICRSGGARRSAPAAAGAACRCPATRAPGAPGFAPGASAACCTADGGGARTIVSGAPVGGNGSLVTRLGRRGGQAKSSARPASVRVGSPFTSMRLATGSSAGGGTALPAGGAPPRRSSGSFSGVPSRITGPASGRDAGPEGLAACAGAGSAGRRQRRRDRLAQHAAQIALDIMRELAGAELGEMDAVIGAQRADLSGLVGTALHEIVALVDEAVPDIDEDQAGLLDARAHQIVEILQIGGRLEPAHRRHADPQDRHIAGLQRRDGFVDPRAVKLFPFLGAEFGRTDRARALGRGNDGSFVVVRIGGRLRQAAGCALACGVTARGASAVPGFAAAGLADRGWRRVRASPAGHAGRPAPRSPAASRPRSDRARPSTIRSRCAARSGSVPNRPCACARCRFPGSRPAPLRDRKRASPPSNRRAPECGWSAAPPDASAPARSSARPRVGTARTNLRLLARRPEKAVVERKELRRRRPGDGERGRRKTRGADGPCPEKLSADRLRRHIGVHAGIPAAAAGVRILHSKRRWRSEGRGGFSR